eukprot:251740-Ditylum_brightwellii.AAC.1
MAVLSYQNSIGAVIPNYLLPSGMLKEYKNGQDCRPNDITHAYVKCDLIMPEIDLSKTPA